MIGRLLGGRGEAPTSDIRIEDRRASGGGLRGSRRPARLVVDYAEDTDRCMRVIAQLTGEYERYVESEHAVCPDCPVVRSGPFVVYSMLEWKAIYGEALFRFHVQRSSVDAPTTQAGHAPHQTTQSKQQQE